MNFKTKKMVIAGAVALFSLASVFASGKKEKLFSTIENGSYKEVKSIMRENKDYINATRGDNKETILMVALKEDRNLDVITLLLKYGADPMLKNKQKQNSVMYACQYSSDPAVLEKLIKTHAFFNSTKRRRILKKDKEGRTSYDFARLNSNPDAMLEVLNKWAVEPVPEEEKSEEAAEKPAEAESSQDSGEDEVLYADEKKTGFVEPVTLQKEPENPEPEEKTLEPEASPVTIPVVKAEPQENTVQEEETAAQAVTEAPVFETPQQEEAPAKAEETPQETYTPSVTTASQPVPEVNPYKKTYLFDYAELEDDDDLAPEDPAFDPDHIRIENPDKRDLNGRTKLMAAAKNGDLKLMENLIYSDADVNAKDNDGWTALMFASRFTDNLKVVQSLIKNGADKDAKNNYGVSALKLASGFNKNAAITAELLSGHTAAEKEVRSSFLYAVTNGASAEVLSVFLKTGVPLNTAYDGKTPLMYAAETNKDTKTIAWLIKNGAKTTYRTANGMTAFDFAKQNKNLPHDQNYWALNSSGEN